MIEVDPDVACMLYLTAGLFAVIGIWLLGRKKGRRKDVLAFTSMHIRCEFCHSAYLDDPEKPFTRCPECQFLNKTKRQHAK